MRIWNVNTGAVGEATREALDAQHWRYGWVSAPRVPSCSTGPVRRMAVCGHSYSYVGVSTAPDTIPNKVAATLAHGRWSYSFTSAASNSNPPSWCAWTSGVWKAVGTPRALTLQGGASVARIMLDLGDTDGIFTANLGGMRDWSTIVLRGVDENNCWRLVGSASFAGWILQRVENGAVTWTSGSSLGLTGYGDGLWSFHFAGSTLRVVTPANAVATLWDLPAGPHGTIWGIEQPANTPINTAKVFSLGWTPLEMLGVSGSIAAGNDTIGAGSWSTAVRTLPALGRGDFGLIIWGINDCVAQLETPHVEGMKAVISWMLAGTHHEDDSPGVDYGEAWAQESLPTSTGWGRVLPTDWRHSGRTLTRTYTPGARFTIRAVPGCGVTALRFVNPPNGGTVAVSVNGGPETQHVITGGTGWGLHAAKTIRLGILPAGPDGSVTISVRVVSLVAGGYVLFDGWHEELAISEQPRVVYCDIARLPSTGVPAPWDSVTPAFVAARNAAVNAMVSTEFAGAKVAKAAIDAALGGVSSRFADGLHPNSTGTALCATAISAALATLAQ